MSVLFYLAITAEMTQFSFPPKYMNNDIKRIEVTMCDSLTGEILYTYSRVHQFTKPIRTRLEDTVRSLNRGVISGRDLSLIVSVSSVHCSFEGNLPYVY